MPLFAICDHRALPFGNFGMREGSDSEAILKYVPPMQILMWVFLKRQVQTSQKVSSRNRNPNKWWVFWFTFLFPAPKGRYPSKTKPFLNLERFELQPGFGALSRECATNGLCPQTFGHNALGVGKNWKPGIPKNTPRFGSDFLEVPLGMV